MSTEIKKEIALEIAHVLFIDIVGYSKLSINDQNAAVEELTQVVRGSEQFQKAEAAGRLLKIATGDGMALVFYTSPEAPAQCAVEINRARKGHPRLQLRMGIHSGPVSGLVDVNNRPNLAGAGLNMAQRVMDCGDAGHILVSKHVAEDLEEYEHWRPLLHELGTCEVKHGMRVAIANLYADQVGNPQLPKKFQALKKRRARMRWAAITAVLLALAAMVAGIAMFSRYRVRSTLPAPEKSIAVLPFENRSEDKANAYFADGIQDEILSRLSKIADLKVISRTSTQHYKSAPENLPEIAKQLGVAHILEGSVQKNGDAVRVNVQLIKAVNDSHLWAETFDRKLIDIFSVESEVARAIADQLQAKLTGREEQALAERPTADPVAYAYYTQAKAMDVWSDWEGGAEKSLTRKAELLEKATQRDPNFALAYCELARTQQDLFLVTNKVDKLDPTALELAAKKAAEAALRLRPDLGEAHLELARYYYYANARSRIATVAATPPPFTGDFDRARDELVIARRTLPNNAEALVIGARIDKRQNRWDDALANLQKASELDPRNDEVARHHRRTLREMRRYNEMEQLIAKNAASGLLRDPWTQEALAVVKLLKGDPVAAQALAAQVPLEFSPDGGIWWIRFTTALYLRDYDAANRVIAATPAKFTTYDAQSWADGQIARARGDNQKAQSVFAAARKWLDAAWEKHCGYFAFAGGLDAGLGRKEEAIREARRAVDLMPIAKDSYNGPELVANLALVYAWTGERDRALEQLEIVATIPTGPSYGDLKFNPCWDDLRGDPRFDKIVAAAKAASR
jgi:TolB-like protein